MKRMIFLTLQLFSASVLFAQTPYDLFISEYVEGSGNNRAIEIYNPTGQTIQLNAYQLVRYEDGLHETGSSYKTQLMGELAPGEVFVLVNGQENGTASSPACSEELQAQADMLDDTYPAPSYFDGNDAIALEKLDGTLVDLIGKIGQNPGKGWSDKPGANFTASHDSLAWTKDHTMVRKSHVWRGIPDNFGATPYVPENFDPSVEWDTLPKDDWTDLGQHTFVATSALPDKQLKLTVYPNPATHGRITVQSDVAIEEAEITTILGRTIYKKTKARPSRQIKLLLSGNQQGLVLLKIRMTNGQESVRKIILATQ